MFFVIEWKHAIFHCLWDTNSSVPECVKKRHFKSLLLATFFVHIHANMICLFQGHWWWPENPLSGFRIYVRLSDICYIDFQDTNMRSLYWDSSSGDPSLVMGSVYVCVCLPVWESVRLSDILCLLSGFECEKFVLRFQQWRPIPGKGFWLCVCPCVWYLLCLLSGCENEKFVLRFQQWRVARPIPDNGFCLCLSVCLISAILTFRMRVWEVCLEISAVAAHPW